MDLLVEEMPLKARLVECLSMNTILTLQFWVILLMLVVLVCRTTQQSEVPNEYGQCEVILGTRSQMHGGPLIMRGSTVVSVVQTSAATGYIPFDNFYAPNVI